MSGKVDAAGRLHMMFGLLDYGRKALSLVALPNKTSWTLLGHLCLAIERYEKPIVVILITSASLLHAYFNSDYASLASVISASRLAVLGKTAA